MSSTLDQRETPTRLANAPSEHTAPAPIPDDLRAAIMSSPDAVLDDKDIMHALVAASEKTQGGNIVDLRSIAMDRLETRLDRLEDTHRNVIAAAYENLAGTNQIHRAILRMMDAGTLERFLSDLQGEVCDILRVDSVCLVMESQTPDDDAALLRLGDAAGDVVYITQPGDIDIYIRGGRSAPARQVTLRQIRTENTAIFGEKATDIRCEACLRLDLGDGHLPGMLVFGAMDAQLFTPQQGSDLLAFFAGVFERTLRRWLD